VHLFGIADGSPFAPGVLEVTNEFLLFGVHRDHRLALPLVLRHRLGGVMELRIAVRMVRALSGLAHRLQAVVQPREQVTHRRWLTACSIRLSSWASRVVLLQVQRSGDIGSPRLVGSTSASSDSSSPGFRSISFLRPPPAARTRRTASLAVADAVPGCLEAMLAASSSASPA
jgi:hypothetical protein